MADEKEIQLLFGRALLDPKFAKKLLNDPIKTASEIGVTIEKGEADAIKATGLTVVGAAKNLDDLIKKAGPDAVAFIDVHKH